jgi:hypothetical protein
MAGSGLFSRQKAAIPHLSKNELDDLRKDIAAEFGPMAAISVEEFTNPAAGGAAVLKAATAVTVAPATVLAADLLAPGIAILLAQARNLSFTTAGSTPADAPATATITGKRGGVAQTEVVNIAQTATIALGVKLWNEVTSIVYSAGQGTDATVAIGIGDAMPLSKTPKTRAGLASPVREIAVGVAVTTGAISAANKSYTPAAAPDGVKDYAVYYEYDATAA